MNSKREELVEEEAFLITKSGEIPEVAYHGALYYLQEDPEGPGINLGDEELARLKNAVIQRYQRIILRDLRPENRSKRIYRGMKRSIINFSRLKKFSSKEGCDIDHVIDEIRERFLNFLKIEVEECSLTSKNTVINCSYGEIVDFALSLGIEVKELPLKLKDLCPPD